MHCLWVLRFLNPHQKSKCIYILEKKKKTVLDRTYNKHHIVFTSFNFVATILISRSYTLNDTGLTAYKRTLIVC